MAQLKILIVKLCSRKFWVWVITTALVATATFTAPEAVINSEFGKYLIIAWLVISALYLIGEASIDIVHKLIDKTSININK